MEEKFRLDFSFDPEMFRYAKTIKDFDLPKEKIGVYLIAQKSHFQSPNFVHPSHAGWFRGEDPTLTIEYLKNKWVENASILYIGRSCGSLRKRINNHIDFWNGKPCAAWGGRTIAQIEDYENLEIWYMECDNPKEKEKELINAFCEKHGALPFANLKH